MQVGESQYVYPKTSVFMFMVGPTDGQYLIKKKKNVLMILLVSDDRKGSGGIKKKTAHL